VIAARAPGRVNLIGDHTDYTGGFVLPMAVDRWTEVRGEPTDLPVVRLTSDREERAASVALDVAAPQLAQPEWARYVAGVVSELRPRTGLLGSVVSTVPMGAGLSSSAALELSVALALGFAGTPLELAQLCRRAEHVATGVPCGIMDQLASAVGVAGHALLIDCQSYAVTPVTLPDEVDVVVVHSGQARALAGSAYAERVAECERAEEVVGPLRRARLQALDGIEDEVVRRRARHVVTENRRVRDAVAALDAGDVVAVGALMRESHASLRDDYEVSSRALDDLVARLDDTPGVLGCRLTGAGFGGCVVALARPGAVTQGWVVRAVDGAHRL